MPGIGERPVVFHGGSNPMTLKKGLRLLLLLSCLLSPGCAGFCRQHLEEQKPPKEAELSEEDRYFQELERDLSMYSD